MCDPCISPPDATDRMLLGWAAKVRHERRMQEIREMDIEAWAREQARARGVMQDVRIYDRVLSDEEIRARHEDYLDDTAGGRDDC